MTKLYMHMIKSDVIFKRQILSEKILNMRFLLLISVLSCLTSCEEKTEACLDQLASNYDVGAELNCMDCCQYPNITLRVLHRFEDTTMSRRDTLVNDIGESFVMLSQNLFLSNIRLYDLAETEIALRDSFLFFQDNNAFSNPRDVVLIRQTLGSPGDFNLSSVRFEGFLNKIQFLIGLDDSYNNMRLTPPPMGTNAFRQNDDMVDEEGRFFTSTYRFVSGLDLNDTIDVQVYDTHFMENQFTMPYEIRGGRQIELSVRMQYDELFKGIRFSSDTPAVISNKISLNMPSALIFE
jgi:hypothetical protein